MVDNDESEHNHRDSEAPWPDACHEFLPCSEHSSCRGCARCNFHEALHDLSLSGGLVLLQVSVDNDQDLCQDRPDGTDEGTQG